MNNLAVILILLLAISAPAGAGVIYDIQTGAYAVGEEVPDIIDVVVTGITSTGSGFLCSEVPSGNYRGIRVHDSNPPAFPVSPGNVITITGASVMEYLGVSGLNIYAWQGDTVAITGSAEIPWVDITYSEVMDDQTSWDSCPIHLTEGYTATSVLNSSIYAISALTSELVHFNGLTGYINAEVDYGDCFQGAYGIWISPDVTLGVVPSGIVVVDCSLPTQVLSFGAIKSVYRR